MSAILTVSVVFAVILISIVAFAITPKGAKFADTQKFEKAVPAGTKDERLVRALQVARERLPLLEGAEKAEVQAFINQFSN